MGPHCITKCKGKVIRWYSSTGVFEWDTQFKTFAEYYRVIRYDVRGCGKSETRRLPYSNSEDLYQLLRVLKVTRASVVGGSMGGSIAVDFALEHPDMENPEEFNRLVRDFLSNR